MVQCTEAQNTTQEVILTNLVPRSFYCPVMINWSMQKQRQKANYHADRGGETCFKEYHVTVAALALQANYKPNCQVYMLDRELFTAITPA